MRWLGLVCVYVAVARLGVAHAEPRRTLEPVALRARPGEKAAIVARLPARAAVKVLASEGRWLRVRVNGVEGYLTRTTVSEPDLGAPVSTNAWSAGRSDGALGRARVEVDAPAVLRVEPEAAPAVLAVRAELGLGLRTLGMSLTSNAEGGLANYVVDAEAVATTLAVDALWRAPARLFVAADLRGAASASSPGIDYPGPTAPAGKIPFKTIAADLGARLGTRVGRGFDVAARLGGHYDAFVARRVRNAGMLPRERLLGATLGAQVDIAPPRSRFTVTARFDALVLGTRKQTAGLEDGAASTAHALWGGLTMRYAMWRRVAVFGGYDFARASTTWTGRSVRQPGVTGTARSDTAQLVELGLSTEL